MRKIMSKEFSIQDDGEFVSFVIDDPNNTITIGPTTNPRYIPFNIKKCVITYDMMRSMVQYHELDIILDTLTQKILDILGDDAMPYENLISDKITDMYEGINNEN